ncbi:MerC domain-containing protein [Verrucomicrobiaceae bacterium R5-34]|uniref:MerC domain-containing protein n=1 Tax=Oceaniferula flava TaxID=2800421 RepID=A0AAE2VD08_9BACT|nr:MerC domain-containing protein [Oceaniferula flavus]MBK1831080.1 MerC domain-containing protein [Verrucomicrobiaceae bacterium R5-34]MBK1855596.1 MerC domain-containing protein [Oceaniferula flavus]MBM1136902.1 MerC domain-containing protein [Oceaniferula flavus]
MELTAEPISLESRANADRIGIFASILCAIHCAVTPVLLLVMPAFGKAWSHPATHWGMAVVVIPIAVYMMVKGFRRHGQKWVLGLGSLGAVLIVIGAMLPYAEADASGPEGTSAMSMEQAPLAESSCCSACDECVEAPVETPMAAQCVDNCCPSIVVDEAGEKSLHIPPASIVTTLGGLCLIAVHAANLCCSGCGCCSKK